MTTIRYNTPIGNLMVRDIKEISYMTLTWCMLNFGVNNRRRVPISVVVDFAHEDGDACGMYTSKDNRIYLYLQHAKSVKDIVSTIIHEYTHSMQAITTMYDKLYRQHKYYSRHPFERSARYNERKYAKICWDQIKYSV